MLKSNQSDYSGPRGRFLTTWKLLRDPYNSYRIWSEKYGDTYRVRALNGDVIVTSNTENIRNIFAARSDAVGQFAIGTLEPLLGGKSVILSEGESHRQQRRLLQPSFHGELIADQEPVIKHVAEKVCNDWESGSTIRVMDHSLAVSLEIIIRVVFGVADNDMVDRFKSEVKRFVRAFHPLLAFSKLLQRPLFGLSPWNKFIRIKQECMGLVQKEIDERRKSGIRGDDLLSRLLVAQTENEFEISDNQIHAQLVTMLFAGHETTQIAIAWAMSWLARSQEYASELRAELESQDFHEVIRNSKLLEGICNESLRLNPIVPDMIRVLKAPLQFTDRVIPAGTNVAMIASRVHYDPSIYSEPNTFAPHRWSEKTYKPYEFFAFGGGVRRCIGAPLAILEMKVVIATWIKQFCFRLPPGAPAEEPVHRRNLVMAPSTGVLLQVERI